MNSDFEIDMLWRRINVLEERIKQLNKMYDDAMALAFQRIILLEKEVYGKNDDQTVTEE